jgi:hypothetical protein
MIGADMEGASGLQLVFFSCARVATHIFSVAHVATNISFSCVYVATVIFCRLRMGCN